MSDNASFSITSVSEEALLPQESREAAFTTRPPEASSSSALAANMLAATELERVPPQSLQAEQALLGGALLDNDALTQVVEIVQPHYFYRSVHQQIYKVIAELFEKGEPVDVISVSEVLNARDLLTEVGGRSYINDLALSVLTTDNLVYYAKIIRDKSLMRSLIQAGTEVVAVGYEAEEADKAIDEAQQAVFAVAQQGLSSDLVHIEDILPTTFDQIEERNQNKGSLMGVATGFYDLDNYLSGLQKSDLIILAARPSMGKTAFCLNIATSVALKENRSVLFFSLEMSKEQLVQRMLCSQAEIDAQRIRTGEINEMDFQKLSRAMGELGDAPIYIDDTPNMSVMEMRAKARKLMMERKGEPIGLIVIDYLQLMEGRGGGGGDNRQNEIAAISRGLKGLARELQCPVMALSQLSRAVESRPDKKTHAQ